MPTVLKAGAVASLLILAATGLAAAQPCPPLAVGNPDGNYIVPGVQGDIVYRRVDGTALALDAYVQRTGDRRPAVVVIHGGGWDTGSRAAFTGQFLELLARAGYNWFAIDYRLNGLARFTDAADDVRAAVGFVRCHAAEFRIDPDRIALVGEDAGAQLALLVGADAPAGVTAVVSVGGFYDLASVSGLAAKHPADLLLRASPARQPLTKVPATLLIHGGGDTEVPPGQADAYCAAVRAARRSCELVTVENAIHRPENWWPSQWGYKARLTSWLAGTLRLAAANHEPYATRLQKDVVFSSARGLALDAWTPDGPGPFPAVIVAHGGGWEAGDKVTYVTPLFEPLAKAGFAWFSIDYRLTPAFRNADQLDDLRDAVRFVRDNATRFHVDPARIAILGESASGQMVAQLATEPVAGVAAVVSFYGVYDFLQMATSFAPRSVPARLFGLTGMADDARAVLMRYSPLYQVTRGMPPLLLVQGTADRLHAQAVTLAAKLDEVGATYDKYDVPGAPHGVENWEGHVDWMGYKKVLVDWLSRKLAVQAGPPTGASAPGPEYRKLEALVGVWHFEGAVNAVPAVGATDAGPVVYTHINRMANGGYFLETRRSGTTPRGDATELFVYSYNPVTKKYRQDGYTSRGVLRTFTGTIEGDTWIFVGTNTSLSGETTQERFTLVYSPDMSSATVRSEHSKNGVDWYERLTGKYTRLSAAAPAP